MKDYFVYNEEYKEWRHKTPLKCFVNPILRKIQFWTDRLFVIASMCDILENNKPVFLKYKIKRVKYYKGK